MFDVFISYNRVDRVAVLQVGEELRQQGVRVWIDVEQLPLGQPWQEGLERIIQTCGAALVCLGSAGLGRWETREMRGLLEEFMERKQPIIPLVLPGTPNEMKLPVFLRAFHGVDARQGMSEEHIRRMVAGIQRRKCSAGSQKH